MHCTLVGADPAQLAVAGQMPPIFAGVLSDRGKIGADDEVTHRFDGHAANIVAPADGEGQAVAFKTRLIRVENDISRRIIRVGVHGIGAVQALGCGETQVENTQISNFCHGRLLAVSAYGIVQSWWKVSSIIAHHSPSLRVSSGFWQGMVKDHHSWFLGLAAIFAISALKSVP